MVVPIVAMAIVAAVISSKQLPVVKHDWDDQILERCGKAEKFDVCERPSRYFLCRHVGVTNNT